MGLHIDIVRDSLGANFRKFMEVTGRGAADVLKRCARGIHRRWASLMPPASEGNGAGTALGRDAYNAGKAKIHRNLLSVLAPRTLKHKRKERVPDVEAAYRSRLVYRNAGIGARVGRGAVYYVDRQKFLALEKGKQASIGRLASGLVAGARMLNVSLPVWVTRHGAGRGYAVNNTFSSSHLLVGAGMNAPGVPANIRTAAARRLNVAVRYQGAATQRELRYLIYKSAAAAAMKTRDFSGLVPAGMAGAAA